MRRFLTAGLVCLWRGSTARAQVLFQHFYYPTPDFTVENSWWIQAREQLAELKKLGVWGRWHPVPTKGGSGAVSMGYDPYDLYDLGSKDQRGTVATHFGAKDQYLRYVAVAHSNGLSVISDVVLNHTGGADRAEANPEMEKLNWDDISDDTKVPTDHLPPGYDPKTTNLRSWTGFLPKGATGVPGTGRFQRNYKHFHPSAIHPNHDQPYHHPDFGSDYCFEAENKYVWNNLLRWGSWFKAQSGVDGFRLDAVKLMEPEFLDEFSKIAGGAGFWQVGEFWDTNPQLLSTFQQKTHNQMKLFDFGLFYALKDMVTKPDFDMRDLLSRRFADRERAVTFVSNHDVDRYDPIPKDKRLLPYAILMAMSGQPSIFHQDYFSPVDAALPETLRTLVGVHNGYAMNRKEKVLLATKDTLAIEREGGLVAVFVRPGAIDQKLTIPTGWRNRNLVSVDGSLLHLRTDKKGTLQLTLPSGGWRLLAPEGLKPAKLTPRQHATTQVYEFDDDLDTGKLGQLVRSVRVIAAKGTPLSAAISHTSGKGSVRLELRDSDGRIIATSSRGRGGRGPDIRLNAPSTGEYRFSVTAPGDKPTPGLLTITYTAAI
ncbi:MAG: alpha-amylase family glycosyl hydrolase [Armatimonas sp.]